MNDSQSPENIALERDKLGFREEASQSFAFLKEMGFTEAGSSSTIVRYKRGDLCVHIYHGRQSYEVEFEIIRDGKRYSLSELIRLVAPAEGEAYRNSTATTATAVRSGVNRVRELVWRCATMALRGDPATFLALDRQRKEWAEALGLKTQAASHKPRADEAFRLGHYAEASQIYERIRSVLSPAEMKKADLARERSGSASVGSVSSKRLPGRPTPR
jgi:hypothetical protein